MHGLSSCFQLCVFLKDSAFPCGLSSSGKTGRARIRGKGDPGYGATSKMLAELGLCLAFDDEAVRA
eukprot:SAG22_NODE_402_length_11035_cov_6.315929_7_plen_66_part_00